MVMPVMHEQMHQQAAGKRQVKENVEQVVAVPSEEQHSRLVAPRRAGRASSRDPRPPIAAN